MALVDFFNTSAFNAVSLTLGINKFPNMYGRVGDLGIFREIGVPTRSVLVEEQNGVLNLLPSKSLGAPGTQGTIGKRKVRSFVIPHIPHDDSVLPEEVQNVRQFGSENGLQTLSELMSRKLLTMSAKHDITREHLRMGALKGIILDGDGTTTLYNLYTEFGITAKTISFALTTSATEVISKTLELKRHIEDNLLGEVMNGIQVLCSPEFYDALTIHPNVKTAFQYYLSNQKLSGDYRSAFEFGGVMFEEYRGQATNAAGTVVKFIAANEAHAFPIGTVNTFDLYSAPADFNEAANTLGLPKYAKQMERDFGRGWDIHTQSNPLPICKRPEVLVKLTKT